MSIKIPDADGQKLSLPNWIPGSYMIRDFSKNIITMKASCDEKELTVFKLDKSNWQIEVCNGPLLVEYDIYALDLSVRSAHMDNTHAFFNGSSLFLEPAGFDQQQLEVEIKQSPYHRERNWTVKTALTKKRVDENGFGRYKALNYDELIDSPVEVSCSVDIAFEVKGVPHFLHLTGDLPRDLDEGCLATDLAAICQEHVEMFDGDLPLSQYLFLTMVVQDGYGGLEHKASTALVCSPDDLPTKQQKEQSADYRKFLGLCSHEYFHLWNVKRIRPLVFQQNALSSEVHTTLLWAFEGITSYYDDLALLRSSRITLENYLEQLAQTLTRLYRTEGRSRQSLADSSFDAWTKFYKQDENAINAIVSYYTKGAIVALGLDIIMRLRTENRVTLDDLMRRMWADHGKTEKGVAEEDIEILVEELVGQPMRVFFDHCLRSTKALPVEEWLNALGIGIQFRVEKSATDQGEYIKIDENAETKSLQDSLTLGFRLKDNSTDILNVYNDSPAEQSGLCPGDTVVALDGKKLTAQNFEKSVRRLVAEKEILIHIFRRDSLQEYKIRPVQQKPNVCDLYLLDKSELDENQQQLQTSWLATSVQN